MIGGILCDMKLKHYKTISAKMKQNLTVNTLKIN